MKVVRNEFVEPLKLAIGNVEEDRPPPSPPNARGSTAIPSWCRSSSGGSWLATNGSCSTSSSDTAVSSGIRRGINSGSSVDSMISVSFIAGAPISTADSALS